MAGTSQVKEITARLEQGVKDLFESDRYADYLKTMSRFHQYSTRNTLLIHMQKPGATLVAGYTSWPRKFGRHVKKGEKGIAILAPRPFTVREEKEKIDPVTHKPVLDDNGMPVVEYKERQFARFKVVSVFDVSQTDGKPIPSLAKDLAGNVEQYAAFMDALKETSPLPIIFEPMPEDTDGTCYFGNRIAIREGMSEIQTVSAVIHEMAHAKLHDQALLEAGEDTKPKDKRTEEVEAESISYAVCQFFGIETGENSFGYLAEWSRGKELKELNASLDTIRKTATVLIDAIDGRFGELVEECGIAFAVGEDQISMYELAEVQDVKAPAQDILDVAQSHDTQVPKPDIPESTPLLNHSSSVVEAISKVFTEPERETLKGAMPELTLPDIYETIAEIAGFGYSQEDMYPLSGDRALELFDTGHTIYMLHNDNTEDMAFDRDEIITHSSEGFCGITKADWEMSSVFASQKAIAENSEGRREAELLHGDGDMFGIYQIKGGAEMRDYIFEAHSRLKEQGLSVHRGNYELVHTAAIPDWVAVNTDKNPVLNRIYEIFDKGCEGYKGRSVSASDVIVLKLDSGVTSHYVDSSGFQELSSFTGHEKQPEPVLSEPDTYSQLGNNTHVPPAGPSVAELEADVNAGRQISLTELAAAIHRERPAASKSKLTLDERLAQGKRETVQQDKQDKQNKNNREV